MNIPNPITAAELHQICSSVYGYGYQTRLSEDLETDLRVVQRWFAGDCRMPASAIVALRSVVKKKRNAAHTRLFS